MRTLIDSICENGHKHYDVWYDTLTRKTDNCPECGAVCSRLYEARSTGGVHGDECDVWIKHGLCNADGSPRHYTSRQELAREAKKRGYTNAVSHVVDPHSGSDKSKHTQRFV